MSKKINKVARWQVSVNAEQKKILEEMMKEDLQTEVSDFYNFCLVQEYKKRKVEKEKRPQGRPKGSTKDSMEDDSEEDPFDYTDDLPKNIPYYGQMIGKREYDDKLALQASFKPQG